MSQDLGFCFCEQLFPCFSKSDPDLTCLERELRVACGRGDEGVECPQLARVSTLKRKKQTKMNP